MANPEMTVGTVTIAAGRPRELAQFYARLLGWRIVAEDPARPGKPPEDGGAQVAPPEGETGICLNFEFDEHYQRPVWPSVDGLQTASQHLDSVWRTWMLRRPGRLIRAQFLPTANRRRMSGCCSIPMAIRSACADRRAEYWRGRGSKNT